MCRINDGLFSVVKQEASSLSAQQHASPLQAATMSQEAQLCSALASADSSM